MAAATPIAATAVDSKALKVAIIGGGNIGLAIAFGLLESGAYEPANITLTRRHPEALHALPQLKNCVITSDNKSAVKNSQFVVLAIKPKQTLEVLEEIKAILQVDKHVLISIVTGISISEMRTAAGGSDALPIYRAMPNTAIAIRESMTCIASKGSKRGEAEVLAMFDKLGKSIVIDEELMAAATVLGACGIAYALKFIRAASQGGIEIGFSAEVAQLITSQTVRGAAILLQKGGQHPEKEIDKVTTPQGCTIAGLNEMEHQGFTSALIKGINASHNKIAKISHADTHKH